MTHDDRDHGEGAEHLAVYGTLAPGAANHHVLADVPGEWSTGTVTGTRHDDGWHGYPGVVPGGSGTVEVDVLRSTQLPLARLDAFEGPGYQRVVLPVRLDGDGVVDAWVYVLAGPPTG